MFLRAAAATAALVLATWASGCSDPPPAAPGAPEPPPLSDGTLPATTPHQAGVRVGELTTRGVGPSCVPCHADVAERFLSSGMSDALVLPSGAGSIEADLVGKTCVDPQTGITVRFGAREGRYLQRMVYVDPAGIERAAVEFPVDLVVGSGHATRTYLQVRDGRILELPATWYRETGKLGLSPGSHFRAASLARVFHRCIECHAGDVTQHPRGTVGVFAGEISLGITCRRCHGDAPEHVRTGKPADVVNPVNLPVERQEEICAQCHLSAAAIVPLPGTSLARDYVPGTPLGRMLAVFADAHAPGDAADTAIAGHGTRMRMSRCSTESGRDGLPAMVCTTCHDPHEGHRLGHEERQLDRGCAVCHTDASCTLPRPEREGRRCSSCHMAVRPSSDIAHTRTTDHFIQTRPPATHGAARPPEETFIGALAVADRPLRNLLDPEGAYPSSKLLLALAYQQGIETAGGVLQRNAPGYAARLDRLTQELLRERPDDPEVVLLRASARLRSGAPEEAVRTILDLEARSGPRPDSKLLLAIAHRTARNPSGTAEAARAALDDDPYEEVAGSLLAEAYVDLGRPADAVAVLAGLRDRIGPATNRAGQMIEAARRARDAARGVEAAYDLLMFRPRDPYALADAAHVLAFDAGDAAQARVLFRAALDLDAACLTALVGLAQVEAAGGDAAEAVRLAQRAERIEPGIPEVRRILSGSR